MAEVDEYFDNHVLSVCAALGGYETVEKGVEPVYVPGDDSIACLRDLKRFLRTAEQTKDRHVHNLLRKWNVLQNDLLPLLITSVRSNNLKVAALVCELLVPLTWPYDQNGQSKYQDEIKEYQEAFLKDNVISSVLTVLIHLFSIPYKQRAENDHTRLRLFFSLFRNLIAANDVQVAVTASAESHWRSVHQERLIIQLEKDGIIDLLLSICGSLSSEEFEGWNVLILEIIYMIFHRRDISELFIEKPKGEQLATLLKKEQSLKTACSNPKHSRHSRFGGTLTVSLPNGSRINTRDITTKDVLKDIAITDIPRGKTRNLAAIDSKISIESPTVRKLFGKIASTFVSDAFNDLAISLKRDFDREKTSLKDSDNMHYLWLCQFAFSFRRMSCIGSTPIGVDSILGVFNVPNLAFTIRRLTASRDEKNPLETTQCLRFLDELLLVVEELSQSSNDELCDLSTQLISALYYEHGNALLLRSLCKEFKQHTKSYLEALVACIDTLINVTKRNTAKRGFLITRKKVKKLQNDAQNTEDQDIMYNESDTEESRHQEQYTENAFDFKSYVAGFASESTVVTYCKLLKYYPDLSPTIATKILSMFKRLFCEQKYHEPFFKLSVLALLYHVSTKNVGSTAALLGKEFEEFTKLVSKALITKISRNKDRGPLEMINILFSSTSGNVDNSQTTKLDEDVLRNSISDTIFCVAALEYWLGTAMRQDIKATLFKELRDSFTAALQHTTMPAFSEMIQKLIHTSDELQILFEAACLSLNHEHGSLSIPVMWSNSDLVAAIQTIDILQGHKRSARPRSGSSFKKAKTAEPVNNLSSKFVEESDEDEETTAIFFEREAELRKAAENAWKMQASKNAV
ncbi:hypothetical protein BDV3_003170 [Batrachochytrium dendrobatidis]